MKKTFLLACILFICFLLTSCPINVKKFTINPNESKEQIARSYVLKELGINNILIGRSAVSDEYPDFLKEILIVDNQGNEVYFNDFSEEEKQTFYENWKEDTIDNVIDKITDDDDLAVLLQLENTAYDITLSECNPRSAYIDASEFTNKYLKNIEKVANANTEQSRSVTNNNWKEITKDCLNQASVEKLKSKYKKGRIIYAAEGSIIPEVQLIGHISMLSEEKWIDDWKTEGRSKVTISAYPNKKPLFGGLKKNMVVWDGKIDGVQKEPLGLWAGNAEGSISNVRLYDVRGHKQNLSWFKIIHTYYPATDKQYNAAADYAIDHISAPYSYNFLWKYSEDKFFCSSLVYKAWLKQGKMFDMSFGITVSPSNIATSRNTVEVLRYKNK